MRRYIAAIAMLVVTGMAVPALAGHGTSDFVKTGTILVGDPLTRTVFGVSELDDPCDGLADDNSIPPGVANGIDGFIIPLPYDSEKGESLLAGHDATLTADAPNDVDAWFYDESCALIKPASDPNAYAMAGTTVEPDGNEAGKIPVAASYVVVDLYVGAAANFTFTVKAAA